MIPVQCLSFKKNSSKHRKDDKSYQKQVKNCPYESQSSRSDMKGILRQLEEMNPEARYSLWGSMTNVQEELLPDKID